MLKPGLRLRYISQQKGHKKTIHTTHLQWEGRVAERETGDCKTPNVPEDGPIRPKHVVKGNVPRIV
jgi:hypothetical protein